jgi:hypothetical protein
MKLPYAIGFVVAGLTLAVVGARAQSTAPPHDEMLLLKLKWATAHPIRSARDLARFLTVQPLCSNP